MARPRLLSVADDSGAHAGQETSQKYVYERLCAKAERFLSPLGYGTKRGVGRPRVGWLYNRSTK